MRLLLVVPVSERQATGLRVAVETLLEGLRERGVPFNVVPTDYAGAPARSGSFSMRSVCSTLACIVLCAIRLPACRVLYLPLATSLLGFVRDAAVIWIGWICRRRVVGHLHGGGYGSFFEALPSPFKIIVRLTVERLDAVIVLTEGLREEFGFSKTLLARTSVVSNGAPKIPADFVAGPVVRSPAHEVRLIYLSNMIESKGYGDLLEACRMLREKGVSFSCTFCGDFLVTKADPNPTSTDAAKDRFYRKLEEYNLTKVVRHVGVIRSEDKWQMLRGSDLLILPTYYPWEGQPISIIEAFAFSTPVIATRHKGIADLVIDGLNGFIVQEKSPSSIAQAVVRSTKDPASYMRMRRCAYETYQRRLTREHHLNSLLKVVLRASD